MATPMWFVGLLKKVFGLRFIGAKMTNLPIIGTVMERVLHNNLHNGDKLFYLPKDRILVKEHIDDQENLAVPSAIVKHFIKVANHIFLMNTCLCRDAANCQSYDHNIGCIFLGDAVQKINPKLGRLVDAETALAHVDRAQKAGLVHLIGRDKIDAIWMGVKPYEKLMTICNCCSCCCLFRVLPYFSTKLQKKIERMPGVCVQVGEDCIGCGVCTEDVCFVDAIQLVDGVAVISEECRGCGNCVEVCPEGAIKIVINREDYVDAALLRLSETVDVL